MQKSLQSLTDTFFGGKQCDEITQLQTMAETCSCHDLLIVFLLLLNVDKNLKHTILYCEVSTHSVKLERFLLDLKEDLVVQFFIDDSCSKNWFVSACEECWVLA